MEKAGLQEADRTLGGTGGPPGNRRTQQAAPEQGDQRFHYGFKEQRDPGVYRGRDPGCCAPGKDKQEFHTPYQPLCQVLSQCST